jgi:hypothetical protein
MGTCEMKWLWKPWNDDSFYWKILKVNMTCEWLGEFYKNWWLGSDAIPFQFESTPTIPNMGKGLTRNLCALVWVPSKQASSGLGWRLPLQQKNWWEMMLIWGECTAQALCSSRVDCGFHREAKLMGRGAHTRVCKWKVMVGSPHTEYGKSGPVNPDGLLQMLWHKCTTSAECRTIRIAVSTVMDGWKGHTVPSSDHFQKCDIWLVTWIWKVNGDFELNHNRVVGMTLMFPLELV